jgi:hypothetical protein
MIQPFNDDGKTARQGRTKVLRDVAVASPDQTSEKLAARLEELGIGQKVRQAWLTGNMEREIWLERQRDYLQDWDEFLVSTSQGAFTGASTLHLPLPFIVARAMHARFYQALLGTEPSFSVKPNNEASVDRAQLITDLMWYAVHSWGNRNRGIDEEADKWLWEWTTAGSGLMKLRWDCDYEKCVTTNSKQVLRAPRIEHAPDGTVNLQPQYEQQWREREEQIKVWEGPVWYNRRHEDVLIIGGEGDPQRAELLIDRDFLNAHQMWSLVDSKVFRSAQTEKAIASGSDRVSGQASTQIKDIRAHNAGQTSSDSQHAEHQYQVLEAYMGLDLDGSGIQTQVVVWVHYRSCEILRAAYLRRLSPAGERPIFKIDFHKRPGAEYGVGIIEILHPLSVEMDAIHNMRIDWGLLSTMPFGFFKPSSSIDPTVLSLEPGALIPTDNPGDVYFPNMGNRTAFGAQEEQALEAWAEKLTSLNDMSYGVMQGAQGATRTATGAKALVNETNTNLDIYLRRLNRGWRQLLQATFHLLQKRLPPGLEFRVTGQYGDDFFVKIRDAEVLHGEYDFDISPTAATSSQSTQQDIAAQLMQATANPLDIQLGLVTAANRYEAFRSWLKSLGLKDFNKFVTRPAGYEYQPTPAEEVNRVLRGIQVPVQMNGDHQGFIDIAQHILQTDELLGQFDHHQAGLLFAQMQKHTQMMQVVQQLQAQQANKQQVMTNSNIGTMAPPQMSQSTQPMSQSVPQSPQVAQGGAR